MIHKKKINKIKTNNKTSQNKIMMNLNKFKNLKTKIKKIINKKKKFRKRKKKKIFRKKKKKKLRKKRKK